MQLKQIKIAGFKSFADPVTIHMPRAVAGIVGPNGSGKSNVIDALRWVVGESSAKSLRGETLDDVIFNGSEQRKPSARASVELLFDNSMNRCPAQWSKYAEISISRTVTRDGVSEYSINNTRTRRRDVKELFLGTGFGPRSYSIIEQGMISRIVEGKPEDLSAFIEEASGVSRFREKRHETVLKLNRTQDNLERLDDMRAEVETRVRQLKYQADQARRYTKLKEDAARLRAQLLAVEWCELTQRIDKAQSTISELDVERNKRLAKVRSAEADQENSRKGQLELQTKLNDLQMEHYRVNAQISNLDRQIKDNIEEIERDSMNFNRLQRESAELEDNIAELKDKEDSVAKESERRHVLLTEAEEVLRLRTQTLESMLSKFTMTQNESDSIDRKVVEAVRRHQSTLAGVDELERRQKDAQSRLQVLEEELTELNARIQKDTNDRLQMRIEELSGASENLNREIEGSESALAKKRNECDQLINELDQIRDSSQEAQVRLKTLERGLTESQSTEAVEKWLSDNGLGRAPALSSQVKIKNGWERALDRVMGNKMGAVVVNDTERLAQDSDDKPVGAHMYFVESAANHIAAESALTPLAQFVESQGQMVESMLGGVYVAGDIQQGLACRSELGPNECIVTPHGAIVGLNWFSPAVGEEVPAGVMETASLIRQYRTQVECDELHQHTKREQIEKTKKVIAELESTIGHLRRRLAEKSTEITTARSEMDEVRSDRIRSAERKEHLQSQIEQLRQTVSGLHDDRIKFHEQAEAESRECAEIERIKSEMSEQSRQGQAELAQLQESVNEGLATKHRIELEAQKFDSDGELLRASISDQIERLRTTATEQREVGDRISNRDDPVAPLKAKLDEYVIENRLCEDRLSKARNEAEATETNYRKLDQARLNHQLSVEEVNSKLQDVRVETSSLNALVAEVRQKMENLETTPEQELEGLDEEFDLEANQIKLERLNRRIDTVGGVNLIAVKQYEEEKHRKEYMDSQHDDLSRAVETLRATIQKIDQESREQYTEMFNMVNSEYQRLLPQLFGGGSGHLELLGEYPENAGLRIFARPKGKRVHNIQALSGGEKALTAVALILAFFSINPSPVCLLDEIDAPLDDENVYRLCSSLRDLAESTQLVLITHNKITMESVDSLIGVTMPEPNVSRILSVDLQEAQEFVA